ncbi:MAG: efflux RND transporter permease subunit, partial [Rikenellaceae bacterium]
GLAQKIQDGRSEVWFYVRYPETGRQDFQDLEMTKIRTSDGGEYPLSQLCDFEIVRGVTKINHFNSNKEIRVEAYMLDAKESVLPILEEVNMDIMPQLMEKYPDLTYMHQGQVKDSQEEAGNIAIYFSLAFAIITLILIVYFRSLTQGIMILAMIPLAFLAAMWGHLMEGVLLSMMSIWGMVALSGTIINDAVVFMSRYNSCLLEGMTVVEALIESGRSRFRPIMLTSITTTIGLFPLIKETSSDAEFVKPMAISLGYGILLGTIFILALFPALVKSANTLNVMWAKFMGKKNVTPESVETAIIDHNIDTDLEAILAEDEANIKRRTPEIQ